MNEQSLREEIIEWLDGYYHTGLLKGLNYSDIQNVAELLAPCFLSKFTTYKQELEQKQNRNIGMLRQWLNEDRITDATRMVTNQDIKHWLELQ
jgi:hypothetical protein